MANGHVPSTGAVGGMLRDGTLGIYRDHAAPWRPGLLAPNLVRDLDLQLRVGAEVREVQVPVSMLPQWLDVSPVARRRHGL
jgi:hypothetical protein